jgi:stage II sporulation protein AA (anti-sigma F factor antagonist)
MQSGKKHGRNNSGAGEEDTIYEISQRCLIIRLGRELDHHNAVLIREKADKYIERYHVRHIIFDFSRAEFMDSAGIGVILGRYRKVLFIGGRIAVASVGSAIDRVLKLSGLYKIVEKYDSVENALNKLQRA